MLAWWETSRRRRWLWFILLEPPWLLVWGLSISGCRQVELSKITGENHNWVAGLLHSDNCPEKLSTSDHLDQNSSGSVGHRLVRETTDKNGGKNYLNYYLAFSLLFISTFSQLPPSSQAFFPYSYYGSKGEFPELSRVKSILIKAQL